MELGRGAGDEWVVHEDLQEAVDLLLARRLGGALRAGAIAFLGARLFKHVNYDNKIGGAFIKGCRCRSAAGRNARAKRVGSSVLALSMAPCFGLAR